jgi:tetratricopeptide (TPR) repeat protein
VRMPPGQRRIGVVGLGAGTLASYLQEGDQMRFYEINPEVERLAKRYFTFLGMCRGRAEVVLGDARLSLENEPPQNFDLLALDAFNGDAIPIHLLTREAFDDYVRHMKTNGVIALNISSLSLDLEPVVRRLAQEIGYTVEMVVQPANNEAEGVLASRWALLWRKGHSVDPMGVSMTERFRTATLPKVPLWTDDFNGLFPVMRWKSLFGLAPVTVPAAPYSQGASKSAVVIEQCREAVARDPDSSVALNNLACLLATAADPALRNGPDAVRFAEKACALTGYQNTSTLSTLAAAYAEVGRFEDAVSTAEKACTLAAERGEQKTLAGNQRMLEYYRKHRAFHQPR